MKKLTKRQREMSREEFNRLNWEIGNISGGIARREASDRVYDDLTALKSELEYKKNLVTQAIIICETVDEMNNIAENSWR